MPYTSSPWPSTALGYWFLGPTLVPPQPFPIGLTGRDDGVVYYLSHDTGFTHIQLDTLITNVAPGTQFKGSIIYGPNDGPWVPDVTGQALVKLYVQFQRLSYEYGVVTDPSFESANNSKLFTRLNLDNHHYHIWSIPGKFVLGTTGLTYDDMHTIYGT